MVCELPRCFLLSPCVLLTCITDNPINQTILSTFMRKKKIKYDVAKNGQEAVQKWKSGGFHLILVCVLDWNCLMIGIDT